MTGSPDPAQGIAFVDGGYLPLAEAYIPLIDRGFVRSDATYDVVHVFDGKFFRLDDHIERFFASMRGLRMSLPQTKAEIGDILSECVRRCGLRDAYVQMTCTRGIPPPGTRDPRLCINRFYAFAQPFVWIANEEQRRDGVKMIISSVQRIPSESIDQRIKNFHWLDLTMGIFEAYDRDALVPVLMDRHGNVTEGPGFNVFAVAGGRLATPDHGLFEGMTRRTVLELAERKNIPCEVRAVSADELRAADEIFISSTAGGIMPVTEIDGRRVGDGRPGPVTRSMNDLYWAAHTEGPFATAVAYGAKG